MSPAELHLDRDNFLSGVVVRYWDDEYAEELLRVLFGLRKPGQWELA